MSIVIIGIMIVITIRLYTPISIYQAERSLADKRHEILELREKVEELEFNYDELVHVYEESVINTKAMEKELLALKVRWCTVLKMSGMCKPFHCQIFINEIEYFIF